MKVLLVLCCVLSLVSRPVFAVAQQPPPDFTELGDLITADAQHRYRQAWVEQGYWLLEPSPDDYLSAQERAEIGPIAPTNPGLIEKVLHIIEVFIIYIFKTIGTVDVNGILSGVLGAAKDFIKSVLSKRIEEHIGAFGLLIKEVGGFFYQPRLLTDYTISDFDPFDVGRSLFSAILQTIWAISLLSMITQTLTSLTLSQSRLAFEVLRGRFVGWVVLVLLGVYSYEILRFIYGLASEVITWVCGLGIGECYIGPQMSKMFYDHGANATNPLVGAIILLGGVVVLVAGAIFFLVRTLLSFILAFVAPLGIGFATLPLMDVITSIWAKMTASFIGVNLVYGLLGLLLRLLNVELLSGEGDLLAILRMLTAVAFGVLSAAWMIFVLKKSVVLLKVIVKSEVYRMLSRIV